MNRSDKAQGVLYLAGLAAAWAGIRFDLSWLIAIGVAAVGGGYGLGGYDMLVGARTPSADPAQEMTASQKTVVFIRGLIHVGVGLSLILGAAVASVLGTEGLWRLLTGQPGPLLLAIGAVLLGSSVQVALGEGQVASSRVEFLASLPLRLASLPMFVLGLACLAVGGYALLLPANFHATVTSLFAPFIQGP